MIINKTNYGFEIIVPTTENNDEFRYQVRQVRVLNSGALPEEESLISYLERKEKRLVKVLLNKIKKMEHLFGQLTTPQEWKRWEERNGDFNEQFHNAIENLIWEIDDLSTQFCLKSRHGWSF